MGVKSKRPQKNVDVEETRYWDEWVVEMVSANQYYSEEFLKHLLTWMQSTCIQRQIEPTELGRRVLAQARRGTTASGLTTLLTRASLEIPLRSEIERSPYTAIKRR